MATREKPQVIWMAYQLAYPLMAAKERTQVMDGSGRLFNRERPQVILVWMAQGDGVYHSQGEVLEILRHVRILDDDVEQVDRRRHLLRRRGGWQGGGVLAFTPFATPYYSVLAHTTTTGIQE